jgi:hypothetical protein
MLTFSWLRSWIGFRTFYGLFHSSSSKRCWNSIARGTFSTIHAYHSIYNEITSARALSPRQLPKFKWKRDAVNVDWAIKRTEFTTATHVSMSVCISLPKDMFIGLLISLSLTGCLHGTVLNDSLSVLTSVSWTEDSYMSVCVWEIKEVQKFGETKKNRAVFFDFHSIKTLCVKY